MRRLLEHGSQVLFLWDEAERLIDVERNDPGFLESLRGELHHIRDFRFVLAGTQLLFGLRRLHGHCSSFLAAFYSYSLAGLDEDAARQLFSGGKTGGWEPPLPTELVEYGIKWSGGHPLMLQALGALLEERTRYGRGRLDVQTMEECCHDLTVKPDLLRIMEDDFTILRPVQRAVLSAVCRGQKETSTTAISTTIGHSKRAVEEAAALLAHHGYITRNPLRLRFVFYSAMLPQWFSSGTDSGQAQRLSSQGRNPGGDRAGGELAQTIMISYSHEDSDWLKRVTSFLEPILRGSEIELWDDQRIQPGSRWRHDIDKTLSGARVALLLISSDFLLSPFVNEVELPTILARERSGECVVLCLHVRPSALRGVIPSESVQLHQLSEFQALNDPKRPLSALKKHEWETILTSIADEILKWTGHR